MIEGASYSIKHEGSWPRLMKDWAESDLQHSRRVGKLGLLGMWSYVDLSEPVAESQNNGIKVGDHGRLES